LFQKTNQTAQSICVDQIQFQIQQSLYRIRLAKPEPGFWCGSAALLLTSQLAALESELIALGQSLSW
jgi:hypothetical protein